MNYAKNRVPDALSNPIERAADIGAIPGVFQVSSSGAATYSIPILVPPGRAGVQPSLSLNYSSDAGNGFMGVGFHLGGFSSISRCGLTLRQDGEFREVQFDSRDALCLDGARLVLVSGTHFSPGAEYRTQPDSFSKITLLGDPRGNYFQVKTKDGTTLEYGKTQENRLFYSDTLTWYMNKMEDVSGNYVSFKYKPSLGDPSTSVMNLLPQSISYTLSNQEEPKSHEIIFVYDTDRPDQLKGYRFGLLRHSKDLLKRIDIKSYTGFTRNYHFTYETSSATGRQRLSSMKECVEGVCKPPSLFSWDNGGLGEPYSNPGQRYKEKKSGVVFEFYRPGSLLSGDFTRDGQDDLMVFDRSSGHWRFLTNLDLESWGTGASQSILNAGCIGLEAGSVLDYDQDGFNDILLHSPSNQTLVDRCRIGEPSEPDDPAIFPQNRTNWVVLKGNGSNSFIPEILPVPNYKTTDSGSAHLADVNGDGVLDLVQCRVTSTTKQGFCGGTSVGYKVLQSNWELRLHDGSGFSQAPIALPDWSESHSTLSCGFTPTTVPGLCGSKILSVDQDGDGTTELFYFPAIVATSNHEMVAYQNTNNHYKYSPSGMLKARSFFQISENFDHGGSEFFADVNGDGLKDFVSVNQAQGNPSPEISVYWNQGSSSPSIQKHTSVASGEAFYINGVFPVDLDGDGREELMAPPPGGLADSGQGKMWRRISWDNQLNLTSELTSVTFGSGFEEDILPGDSNAKIRAILGSASPRIADVEGDGDQDIINVLKKGHLAEVAVLTNHVDHQDLLKTIRDGFSGDGGVPASSENANPRVKIYYSSPVRINPEYGHYQIDETPQYHQYPYTVVAGGSKKIVLGANFDAGFGLDEQYRSYQFAYRNAVYDRSDRKWIGFSYRITNEIGFSDIKTVSIAQDINHDVKTRGLPTFKQVSDGVLFSRQAYEWDFKEYDTLQGKNWFAYPKVTYLDSDHTHSIQRIDAIDDWGNPTVISRKPPQSSVEEIVTTTFKNDVNLWQIGLPLTYKTETFGGPETKVQFQTFDYDSKGRLRTATVEPDRPEFFLETTLRRDVFGQITQTSTIDAKRIPRESCSTYEPNGYHLFATVNAENHRTYYNIHEGLGVPLAIRGPDGSVARWAYDSFGRITKAVSPDGIVSTQTISNVPNQGQNHNKIFTQIRSAAPGGAEVTTLHNTVGAVVQTKSWSAGPTPKEILSEYSYSDIRHYYSIPHFIEETPVFSESIVGALGLRSVKDPDGAVHKIEHSSPEDFGKNVIINSHTYPGSPEKKYKTYLDDFFQNSYGRVKETKDPLNIVTKFKYGAHFSPPSEVVEDATGKQVSNFSETDHFGRVIASSDSDHGNRTFKYNGFGEIISETDGNGDETFYYYDRLGRLRLKRDKEGSTRWHFDKNPEKPSNTGESIGRITAIESPDGHVQLFFYDNLGRLQEKEHRIDGLSFNVRFSYDDFSRLSTILYPNDFKIQNVYDAHGNLIKIQPADSRSPTPYWELLETDASGRTLREKFKNGVLTTRTYNNLSGTTSSIKSQFLSGAFSQVVQNLSYSYYPNHTLQERKDLLNNQKEVFEYDLLDRIQRVTVGGLEPGAPSSTDLILSYDSLGNILYKSDVGTYTYDPSAPHRVTTAGSSSFSYDNAGNQTLRPSGGISYTPFHKPRKISKDGKDTSLSYSGSGTRVKKQSATHTTYYVDGFYEVTLEKATGIRTHRSYLLGPEKAVAVAQTTEKPKQRDESTFLYLHTDHLGSTDVVTGPGGEVLERRSYDPFGKTRNPTIWGQTSPIAPPKVPLGYTGHEDDNELGLVNMGGRMYDPSLAKFTTPDPFVQSPFNTQSWNRYAYVFNSPVNLTDPSGFCAGTENCSGDFFGAPGGVGFSIGFGGKSNSPSPGANYSPAGNYTPPAPVYTPAAQVKAVAPTTGLSPVSAPPPTALANAGGYSIDDWESKFFRYTGSNARIAGMGLGIGVVSGAALYAAGGGALIAGGQQLIFRLSTMAVLRAPVATGIARDYIAAEVSGGGIAAISPHIAPAAGAATGGYSLGKGLTYALEKVCEGGRCCFAAGTLVWTIHGTKNIEEIHEGDIVLSKDDETGAFSWQPVVQTFVNHDKDLLDLEIVSQDGLVEHILATPEHPFWIEGQGWRAASKLKGGDHTSTADAGGWATVRSVRGPPGKHTTYNFEVANTHTYFVGKNLTWVHNTCDPMEAVIEIFGLPGKYYGPFYHGLNQGGLDKIIRSGKFKITEGQYSDWAARANFSETWKITPMIRRVDEEQIEFFTKQKPDYFHPRNKVVFWYGETKGLRDEFIDIVVTSIGEIDGSITTIHPWIR